MELKCDKCGITSKDTYIMDKSDVDNWPDVYEALCEKCFDESYVL